MQLIQLKVHARLRSFVVFASLGLLIAACGGDSDQPAEPVAAATAAAVATGAPAAASPATTTAPTEPTAPTVTATTASTSTAAPAAAPTAVPTEVPTEVPVATPTQEAAIADAVQHTTDIAGFAFASELRIAVGDGVTWTNQDGVPHTVTADDDSVRSGFMEQGGSVQLVFDQAGTFSYFCSVHPTTMSGLVIVGDGVGVATPTLGAVAAGTASDIDY